MKMPNWLKNTEYDKGKQILGWDPISRTYFDAVAWYRQNNQETDYSYLEKYINNITQNCRRNFASAVARAVPPVVIRPENAENLADMTTAKAAQEAISIIEEANKVKGLLGLESQYLFLYGVELTQALAQVLRVQRFSLSLGELAGQRIKAGGGNPFKRKFAHRQAHPFVQGIWRGSHGRLGCYSSWRGKLAGSGCSLDRGIDLGPGLDSA